jgi:hypothetical protein
MSKVNIGSAYRRKSYVDCTMSRDYSALNAPMCGDSLRLQRQLLGDGPADSGTSDLKSWLLYGLALVLAILAFGFWLDL